MKTRRQTTPIIDALQAVRPDPVGELLVHAKYHPSFIELLTQSLNMARNTAREQLDPALFDALAWPTSYPEYIAYLRDFSRWVPQQSSDPAWKNPNSDEHQEVYDRLCHFYWLIDQGVGANGSVVVEDIPWFSEWLVGYARYWGAFLDTTESFSPEILESFLKNSPMYEVEASMVNGRPNAPSGWLTFNQFFARELNPGLRPIEKPYDNTIVTSPADCTFKAKYDIGPDSKVPGITVKKTHTFASIEQLLDGSPYKNAFANGSFVHYFLGPYSYHRFHTPVAGMVRECRAVHGLVYLDVKLNGGQFDAPDSAQGGYEFAQARGIITVDTAGSPYGDVGVVAIIPIGMCQVSSVNMTAQVEKPCLKGDEFGYFLFGGSDIIVLFQQGVYPKIDTGDQYRRYGTTIASCRTLGSKG